MRVEGLPDNWTAIRTNVADLIGRLDAGDVIKAKVLEITSDEVLLRLFDGSVLKAAAGENLEAKAGQTLTLTVASKSGGTLYLETLKDQSEINSIKPDLIKKLLNTLELKTTANNLELAAEFIKAGVLPTSEQFDEAFGLTKVYKGINAEKAVFMTSNGIRADQVNVDLLSKLLDGDLKLGEQLRDLQSALENAGKKPSGVISGSPSDSTAASVVTDSADSVLVKNALTAEKGMIKENTSSKSETTVTNNSANSRAVFINNKTPETQVAHQSQISSGSEPPETLRISVIQAKRLSDNTANAQNTVNSLNLKGKDIFRQTQPSESLSGKDIDAVTDQDNAALNQKNINLNKDQNVESRLFSRTDKDAIYIRGTPGENTDASDVLSGAVAGDAPETRDKSHPSGSDPFTGFKDTLKNIFISLDTENTADGIDLGKSHRELNDKLDMLKTAIQTQDLKGYPGSDGITAAVNLVDDYAKLLNQLNSSNVSYYQLPVSLAGHNTTAELYVMKRQQGKKRIDPQNSVLFVSLDTDNLGRFEALIDVKGKNVTLNFRTGKQEINDWIKENIKSLYSGLSECGYKLVDIRYALIDSATPPIKLENVLEKMIESNRSKVDVRI